MRDPKKLKAWLEVEAREVSIVISVRAVLRALPIFATARDKRNGKLSSVALATTLMPCFRSIGISWFAAKNPSLGRETIKAAKAAVATFSITGDASSALSLAKAIDAATRNVFANNVAISTALTFAYITSAVLKAFETRIALEIDAALQAAISADAIWIQQGKSPVERSDLAHQLADQKLWLSEQPDGIRSLWPVFRSSLPKKEYWDVWTHWYEDRLEGRTANEALELYRTLLPEEFWQQDPVTINKAIWDKEHEILALQSAAPEQPLSPPEIPAQLPGVHVEIDSDSGKIIFAPPASLDADGNNIAKLQSFQPQIKRLAEEALSNISANEQPELRGALARYFELIDKPLGEINFDLVYAEGLFLEEAASAAERKVTQGLREPLSDAGLAALNGLVGLHPLFVLNSKAGQDNLALARAYEETKEEAEAEREAEKELSKAFSNADDIIAEEIADAFAHTANAEDSTKHEDRSRSARAAFTNNIIVNIATGAALAASPLCLGVLGNFVGGATGTFIGGVAGIVAISQTPVLEGWKKSEPFLAISGLVTKKINEFSEKDVLEEAKRLSHIPFHRYRDFMLEHEILLREWAGTRKSRTWLLKYLDWLKPNSKSGPKN